MAEEWFKNNQCVVPFWLYISSIHEKVHLKELPTFTTVHVCKVLQVYKQYNNGCRDIQDLFMLLVLQIPLRMLLPHTFTKEKQEKQRRRKVFTGHSVLYSRWRKKERKKGGEEKKRKKRREGKCQPSAWIIQMLSTMLFKCRLLPCEFLHQAYKEPLCLRFSALCFFV